MIRHPLTATAAAVLACVAFVIALPRVLVGSPATATAPIQLESPSRDEAGQNAGDIDSTPATRPSADPGAEVEGADTGRPGSSEASGLPRDVGEASAEPAGSARGNEGEPEAREREFEQAQEQAEREADRAEEQAEREADRAEEQADRAADRAEEQAEREAERRD